MLSRLSGLAKGVNSVLQELSGDGEEPLEHESEEEREAADAKLSKLKLQAKAKVVSLNKQIEELKKTTPGSEQGAAEREEEREAADARSRAGYPGSDLCAICPCRRRGRQQMPGAGLVIQVLICVLLVPAGGEGGSRCQEQGWLSRF
ncbi:UNVERIFIED_CONTAM: hypothetical protein FKN15_001926 [Acipenser sinensis]